MTADIALSKAYSAAVMQRPTEMLENWRSSDPVFFTQAGRMGHRPIVATKGGVTIKRDGVILGFVNAVDGLEMRSWDMPWHTGEGVTKLRSHTWVITGRLRQRGRLAAGEAAYVRGLTGAPVKATLIAPGFMADRFWADGITDQAYSSREELAAEMAAITRAEIEALIAEGVRYVQLDNRGYGRFVGAHGRPGEGADFERMVNTDAASVAGLERSDGVVLGLHVCRGNQASMW